MPASPTPVKDTPAGAEWNQAQQAATIQFAGNRRDFTDAEDEVLKTALVLQPRPTILELAFKLRRTWHSVNGRFSYLCRTHQITRRNRRTELQPNGLRRDS